MTNYREMGLGMLTSTRVHLRAYRFFESLAREACSLCVSNTLCGWGIGMCSTPNVTHPSGMECVFGCDRPHLRLAGRLPFQSALRYPCQSCIFPEILVGNASGREKNPTHGTFASKSCASSPPEGRKKGAARNPQRKDETAVE